MSVSAPGATTHRPRPRELADHTTPLIPNCWYVAALSTEVTRIPVARTILGTSVLLFRRGDGHAIALQNRCPHRSFPLDRGRLDGDTIVCGYHGITFASDGSCVRIPSQSTIPSTVCLHAFPLIERGPFLWIWPGDGEPAPLPDIPWLDGGWTSVEGYFHVASNYVALHENVLDLTHASYLHGTDAATLKFAEIEPAVRVDGDVVTVTRIEHESALPPHRQAVLGADVRVDREAVSIFLTPGVHAAHSNYFPAGAGTATTPLSRFEILHLFTPENAMTTHYFWANARDTDLDNVELSDVMRKRSLKVYGEDVEGLGWVDDLRRSEVRSGVREISVAGDRAGLQMRHVLMNIAARERNP